MGYKRSRPGQAGWLALDCRWSSEEVHPPFLSPRFPHLPLVLDHGAAGEKVPGLAEQL